MKPRLEAERCIAGGVKNRSGQKIKQKSALRRRSAGGEQGGRVGVAGCIQCICAVINSSACVVQYAVRGIHTAAIRQASGRSGPSLDEYPRQLRALLTNIYADGKSTARALNNTFNV